MSEELERLRRRLERERAARREAERIAEHATRVLYDKQRDLELVSSVATACNRAGSADEAVRVALHAICEQTGWSVGHAYLRRNGAEVLEPASAWFLNNLERFAEFRAMTQGREFLRGEGLPGRVLEEARPVWIPDVLADGNFPRAEQARAAGIRGALAVPVRVGEEIVAVLEFFSEQPADPRPELLGALGQVADHVARVFERERAQHQLEALNRDLQRSNRDLEQFAYVASHDLSEPLRTITGFATLLQRRSSGQLDEQGREFLAYILDGAGRMQTLISALLELSRVGRVDAAPVRIDLHRLVEEVADDLGARFQDTGGRLEVEGELPTVTARPQDLARVFQNLIGNALKFCRPGMAPLVRVEAEAHDEERWLVSVTDNGIGIAPEHRERIFHVFERLHPRGDYGGTGIGLSVVQRVVEGHGGRVWVEEAEGGGSVFRFTLPA